MQYFRHTYIKFFLCLKFKLNLAVPVACRSFQARDQACATAVMMPNT